ncbi:pumilio-family RNA binding repeat domain-containing protein [Massariosphaeria phaeospora]|uniref:Pumilio-family RNA binding repeat domain-containing protein n=1 Tax=Massariosphaeria phaeospora TaxID=100035 RepID=A0A7C8MP92_9PLEO|nr:pumilio-family RNA binding repeat domain-containing protein [Massariosphaeria phaeospora]
MSFNITSDGSPTPRKGPSRFSEDLRIDTSAEVLGMAVGSRLPFALYRPNKPSLTSTMQGMKRPLGSSAHVNQSMLPPQHNNLDGFKVKVEPGTQSDSNVVDSLLQRLNERSSPTEQYNSSNGSIPITPATDDFANITPITEPDGAVVDASEFHKLKAELLEARNEVARMNQELHTTHLTKSTLDSLGPSSEADYNYADDVTEQTIAQLQNRFNASTRPNYAWGNEASRSFYGRNMNQQGLGPIQPQPQPLSQPQHRPSSGSSGFRGRNGYLNEPAHFPLDQSYRGNSMSNPPSRPPSAFDPPRYNQYANPGMSPTIAPMQMPTMGMYGGGASSWQPAPIGTMTRLSPEAVEFSVTHDMGPTPWNNQAPNEPAQYIAPAEPMNYRKLLDRNMSCNWKYIVDKIILNNDQQASIFLQQKLKVGTGEQKYDIVEAIIAQAYPLMVNRFGNFLVQRCFEHGTPEQIIAIAGAIRGNTLALSMDAFGCHVIQKAFDCVPEEYKATMVHELLRRIPETVIHRYSCHVWQKLFELRWNGSPPQIMRYVNEALRGMWHEVALGETGSLVVQNIFENCLEEDKRPCINEVLASIDIISHGQFGNWCIQHICEHGAPADRSRAIDHILRLATEYSMDQYASKVIEKCLKIGGNEFLERYLERVCEARPDRPRMPLIDIAGDQFGNYLIQYVLTNSGSHHREMVATHIRKHMVSLRGSKYGSRVAMLCCNPALATRPGPPAGMQVRRYDMHRPASYAPFR